MYSQLTQNAIPDMLNGSTKQHNQNYIIQVLNWEPPGKEDSKKVFKTHISDGYCSYKKSYFGSQAYDLLQTLNPADHPIILVKQSRCQTKDDKQQLVIFLIDLLYPACKPIGEPIDYQLYIKSSYTNPDGSREIPADVLGKTPQPNTYNSTAQVAGTPMIQNQNSNSFGTHPNNAQAPRQQQQPQNQQYQQPPIQQQNIQRSPQPQYPPQQNQQQPKYPQQQQQPQPQKQPLPQPQQNNHGHPPNKVSPQPYQNQQPPQQQQQPPRNQLPNMMQNQQRPPQFQQQPPNNARGVNNGAINNHVSTPVGPNQPQRSQPQQYSQQQQYQNFNVGDSKYQSFESLFQTSQFLIKGRVIKKSELKDIVSQKSGKAMKLFNVILLGTDGDKISGTFFNEEAIKFYDQIIEGQVYEFQDGDVRRNENKQYNPGNFQITFNKNSKITQLMDDPEIKFNQFEFIQISDVFEKSLDQKVDVIGVIQKVNEPQMIRMKDNTEKAKRSIYIFDQSQKAIEMTLWGDQAYAQELSLTQEPVILIVKSARISEFGGNRGIGAGFDSQVYFHSSLRQVNIPEVDALMEWKSQVNPEELHIKTPSGNQKRGNILTISQIEEQCQIHQYDQKRFQLWSDIQVYLGQVQIDRNFYYMGCDDCKKRGEELTDNQGRKFYRCKTPGHENTPVVARYICSTRFCDSTGSIWITLFDQIGEEILQMKAQDAKYLSETNIEEFKQKIEELKFKEFRFRILSSYETDEQGITRLKHKLIKIVPPSYQEDLQDHYNQILGYLDSAF